MAKLSLTPMVVILVNSGILSISTSFSSVWFINFSATDKSSSWSSDFDMRSVTYLDMLIEGLHFYVDLQLM